MRKILDVLREKIKKFTPQELLELKNKNVRDSKGIEDFAGIYIIHNRVNDTLDNPIAYSAGLHFLQDHTGNSEIYNIIV